jgi:5-methylcytosine-specific restriction endonuclease McrA
MYTKLSEIFIPAPETDVAGDGLHWSYANLAMAHAAVTHHAARYGVVHYTIRSKLYKGLRSGTMNAGPLADDERLKLILPQACAYCASRERLAADHVVPKHLGGPDVGDNLVWACRSCNSSKGAKDLLAWYAAKEEFPPLLLLRRYLKLAMDLCVETEIMDRPVTDATSLRMEVARVPQKFPPPAALKLWNGW